VKYSTYVKPNAKIHSVKEIDESTLEVHVDAPTQNNKANTRLVELLAEHFEIAKSRIVIQKGHSSRHKIVEILE